MKKHAMHKEKPEKASLKERKLSSSAEKLLLKDQPESSENQKEQSNLLSSAESDEEQRSWALSLRMAAVLNKIGIAFLLLLSSLYIFLVTMMCLTYTGIISVSDPLYGFDMLPSYVVLYLMLAALFIGIIFKRYKTALTLPIIYIFFFVFTGDHSLFVKKDTDYLALDKVLSVATLKTDNYSATFQSVSNEIKKYGFDFVFFQNMESDKKSDAKLTQSAFGDHYNIFTGRFSELGIISRYPFIETHEVMLPSKVPSKETINTPENQTSAKNRYFLHTVVDLDGMHLNLLSMELISGKGYSFFSSPKEAARWLHYIARTQYLETKLITEYVKKLDGPVIFGGSMNAPSRALSMKTFEKTWIDTALFAKMFPHKTFPSENPMHRHDYIFCDNSFIPLYTDVSESIVSKHLIVFSALGLKRLEGRKIDSE